MFSLFRRRGTIIAEGLKIVGSVTAEGLVEVNGHIEGDLHCTSLVVSPKASINGGIEADKIVVNGRVEGPIRGGEVALKSHAYVVGDIQHNSLAIEAGAYFDGRSVRSAASNVKRPAAEKPDKLTARLRRERELSVNGREPATPAAA
jgi:cytoskeletal protein CcmA (bactofilin family)